MHAPRGATSAPGPVKETARHALRRELERAPGYRAAHTARREYAEHRSKPRFQFCRWA